MCENHEAQIPNTSTIKFMGSSPPVWTHNQLLHTKINQYNSLKYLVLYKKIIIMPIVARGRVWDWCLSTIKKILHVGKIKYCL